jgi:hypothetical protein
MLQGYQKAKSTMTPNYTGNPHEIVTGPPLHNRFTLLQGIAPGYVYFGLLRFFENKGDY